MPATKSSTPNPNRQFPKMEMSELSMGAPLKERIAAGPEPDLDRFGEEYRPSQARLKRWGAEILAAMMVRPIDNTPAMTRVAALGTQIDIHPRSPDKGEALQSNPDAEQPQPVTVQEAVAELNSLYPVTGEPIPVDQIEGYGGQRVVPPEVAARYLRDEPKKPMKNEFRHPRPDEVAYGGRPGTVEYMRNRVDEARRTAGHRAGKFGRAVVAKSISAAGTAKDIAGATALALTGEAARELEMERKYGSDVLKMPLKEREEWTRFVDSLPSKRKFLENRIAPSRPLLKVRRAAQKLGLTETPENTGRRPQSYKGRHRKTARS